MRPQQTGSPAGAPARLEEQTVAAEAARNEAVHRLEAIRGTLVQAERRLEGLRNETGEAGARLAEIRAMQDGLLAEVVADHLRHEGIDRLIVGDAASGGVDNGDVARPPGVNDTGHAEQ